MSPTPSAAGSADAAKARPLFVALYGELAVHPWRMEANLSSDTYSLFVARSSAMGWLVSPARPRFGGLWAMNDAGQVPTHAAHPSCFAWFQVDWVGSGQAVPTQPFLSCVSDVVARIGTAHLHGMQLLLPSLEAREQAAADGDPLRLLLADAGWFADRDPRANAPVRITIDGGQVASIRAAASDMFHYLRGIRQEVFTCESLSLIDHDPMAAQPAVVDQLWYGPPLHRVTLRGVLAEWSLAALGWLAAFLADTAVRHGVTTPLMLTTSRSSEMVSTDS